MKKTATIVFNNNVQVTIPNLTNIGYDGVNKTFTFYFNVDDTEYYHADDILDIFTATSCEED